MDLSSGRLTLGSSWSSADDRLPDHPQPNQTLSRAPSLLQSRNGELGSSDDVVPPLQKRFKLAGGAAAANPQPLLTLTDCNPDLLPNPLIINSSSSRAPPTATTTEELFEPSWFVPNHAAQPRNPTVRNLSLLGSPSHNYSSDGLAPEPQPPFSSQEILYQRGNKEYLRWETPDTSLPASSLLDDLWNTAGLNAHIVCHPLFEQLLAAHVACLRVATPHDQLPALQTQLETRHELAAKYMLLGRNAPPPSNREHLDHFMVSYILLLQSFREQLRQHLHVHATEAFAACAELEAAFSSLTGVVNIEMSTKSMSDDEEECSEMYSAGSCVDADDRLGFGSLIPTDAEKSLMENVRRELKLELKQDYKRKLMDIREEIMRKRRAGKLPSTTTSLLKAWWNSHSRWPYPTEEEKSRLVEETGLEIKQINNWFINQRKRNWNTNPSMEHVQLDVDFFHR